MRSWYPWWKIEWVPWIFKIIHHHYSSKVWHGTLSLELSQLYSDDFWLKCNSIQKKKKQQYNYDLLEFQANVSVLNFKNFCHDPKSPKIYVFKHRNSILAFLLSKSTARYKKDTKFCKKITKKQHILLFEQSSIRQF